MRPTKSTVIKTPVSTTVTPSSRPVTSFSPRSRTTLTRLSPQSKSLVSELSRVQTGGTRSRHQLAPVGCRSRRPPGRSPQLDMAGKANAISASSTRDRSSTAPCSSTDELRRALLEERRVALFVVVAPLREAEREHLHHHGDVRVVERLALEELHAREAELQGGHLRDARRELVRVRSQLGR